MMWYKEYKEVSGACEAKLSLAQVFILALTDTTLNWLFGDAAGNTYLMRSWPTTCLTYNLVKLPHLNAYIWLILC